VSLGLKSRPYYKQVALHVPSEIEHALPYQLLRVGREQYTDTYPVFTDRVMDVHHLVYAEQGQGWLETAGRRMGLVPGSIVLLPEGTVNNMGPVVGDPMEITWLVMTGAGLGQVAASAGLTEAEPHAAIGTASEPRAIFRELRLAEPGHIWRAHSLLWALLARVAVATGSRDMGPAPMVFTVPNDHPGRPVGPPEVAVSPDSLFCDDPAVLRAIELARLHFREPSLRVSHLVAAASFGRSRFNQRFRLATGTSPRRHLELVRMEEARRLLEGDVPVGRVAELCGFEDPLYFSRRFRALHGVPPIAYRNISRGAHPTTSTPDRLVA
jgi:AraC family transcriptional regulator, arabinose operon regulatory protein